MKIMAVMAGSVVGPLVCLRAEFIGVLPARDAQLPAEYASVPGDVIVAVLDAPRGRVAVPARLAELLEFLSSAPSEEDLAWWLYSRSAAEAEDLSLLRAAGLVASVPRELSADFVKGLSLMSAEQVEFTAADAPGFVLVSTASGPIRIAGTSLAAASFNGSLAGGLAAAAAESGESVDSVLVSLSADLPAMLRSGLFTLR